MDSVKLSTDVDLHEVASKLVGYSGADITNVCRDAAMMPMRRRIEGLSPDQIKALPKGYYNICNQNFHGIDELGMPVENSDFLTAIRKIHSSVSQSDIVKYEDWMREFGKLLLSFVSQPPCQAVHKIQESFNLHDYQLNNKFIKFVKAPS